MAPKVFVDYMHHKESKKRSRDLSITMMGKAQRVSQGGHSSSFVSDYQHSVEAVGESEGFGSCGFIDSEMAASEDSGAPKRRRISLNADTEGIFNVPVQVVSVMKMSQSERKELNVRLRLELEHVRALQQRIFLSSMNGLTVLSSSGVRSFNDGQKKSAPEAFQKHAPPGCTAPPPKNYNPFEPANRVVVLSNANVMLMKQCETLLRQLMKHQYGWVFNEPVDVVKLNLPDYFTIIKRPMDLGTILTKITTGAYSNPRDFVADVRLTFSNAMTYNPPGNDVHHMADALSKFFEVRWKPIEKKLLATEPQVVPLKSAVPRDKVATDNHLMQSKNTKAPPISNKVKPESMRRNMTNEKQSLSRDLESLLGNMPERIIDFLRGHSDSSNPTSEDEIEVDIDALSDDVLFKLRKLLDDYLLEKRPTQAKSGPCEMEILNESGLGNSSMQPCKGSEPMYEDVDVGGNEPLVSSYPDVETDKDTQRKSSKCCSSSSCSSYSGSSSSDSGSGCSSGSESDGAKVSSPVNDVKASICSKAHYFNCVEEISHLEAATDHERSGLVNQLHENCSFGGSDQLEQNAHPVSEAIEKDDPQEGENAPSERQVSSKKLYRAALLRSRFADTILRAREKTLSQVEKGDPDRLRQEREELERQQREEKARLQAEAKAAEEARQQAEAEAAAEVRRKRELEREAARQALQRMEKTVEIDESSQFLKDLEMLGSAPPDHLPSSVDETSPDDTHDGLGGFKFHGTNPLELLGLYMKVDDDDDEECEPDGAPPNDVEEGEID